ncbi:MAG: hypothetical protein ACF8LL_08665, partial [Phycisphaerales bacterium]
TRLEEATSRMGDLDESIERHARGVETLESQLEEAQRALSDANETKHAASRDAGTHRQRLDETRAACASIEREHATLTTQVQSDERRIESIKEQAAELSDRNEALTQQRTIRSGQIGDTRTEIDRIQSRVHDLEAELHSIAENEELVGETRSQLATLVDELDEQRVRLETRTSTLEEMVKSRAGLDDAVRAVLDRKESGEGFGGVIGPLAELIEVSSEHAAPIESALEDALQSVVVESLGAMPTSEELERLPGRVTFLPLTGMASPTPSDFPLNQLAGVIGPRVTLLRPLVHARANDPRVEDMLDRVLAATLLVADLDTAMLLSAGPLRGIQARFVTHSGTVIEPDGRVCAGPASDNPASGLLARRAELDELSVQLQSHTREYEAKRDELARVDENASRLAEQRSKLHTSIAAAKQSLVESQHVLDKHESELARLEREIERVQDEQRTSGRRLDEIREERASLMDRATKLEGLLEEQQASAEQSRQQLEECERVLEEANETVAGARVQSSTVHEQLRSEQRQLEQLQTQRDESERQCSLAQRHIERAKAILDEHQRVAKESIEQEREATARIEGLETETQEAAALVRQSTETLRGIEQRLAAVRDSAEAFQRDWHAIELAKRETEVKRETIEERTLEDLGIDLVIDYPEYRYMMRDGDIERIDVESTTARVNVLRGEIKKLGSVNIAAIDEEQNLAERNDELISQVKDIDEARIKLATLIEKLNVASRTRFGEVFESIQQEFGGRNGMFRRLFGGGRAEVRLMPLVKEVDGQKVVTDEIDLLESGIEVIAKPPGKEPRSINQLSGGEKTMTAVAMLLAIFRSTPSCFCVLDEVDAALDEANVGRFCSTLDIFAQQSRFIVITHNKRTMQSTDKLFGVTMQERGVSKRVEVRFDQVGEDGEIDKDAIKNAPEEAPEPVVDEESESSAQKPKPTGALRAALATMREDAVAEAR